MTGAVVFALNLVLASRLSSRASSCQQCQKKIKPYQFMLPGKEQNPTNRKNSKNNINGLKLPSPPYPSTCFQCKLCWVRILRALSFAYHPYLHWPKRVAMWVPLSHTYCILSCISHPSDRRCPIVSFLDDVRTCGCSVFAVLWVVEAGMGAHQASFCCNSKIPCLGIQLQDNTLGHTGCVKFCRAGTSSIARVSSSVQAKWIVCFSISFARLHPPFRITASGMALRCSEQLSYHPFVSSIHWRNWIRLHLVLPELTAVYAGLQVDPSISLVPSQRLFCISRGSRSSICYHSRCHLTNPFGKHWVLQHFHLYVFMLFLGTSWRKIHILALANPLVDQFCVPVLFSLRNGLNPSWKNGSPLPGNLTILISSQNVPSRLLSFCKLDAKPHDDTHVYFAYFYKRIMRDPCRLFVCSKGEMVLAGARGIL